MGNAKTSVGPSSRRTSETVLTLRLCQIPRPRVLFAAAHRQVATSRFRDSELQSVGDQGVTDGHFVEPADTPEKRAQILQIEIVPGVDPEFEIACRIGGACVALEDFSGLAGGSCA